MSNQVKSVKEFIDALAPYLTSIEIDAEMDFAVVVNMLFPLNWKIFKDVNYVIQSESFSTGANKYSFTLMHVDGDFDEMIGHIQSIIDWNILFEQKLVEAAKAKEDLMEEMKERMKALDQEILPKPLDGSDITTLLTIPEVTKTKLGPYKPEVDPRDDPNYEPEGKTFNMAELVDQFEPIGGKDKVEVTELGEGFPQLVNVDIDEDSDDDERDDRYEQMQADLKKNTKIQMH